MNRNGIVFLNGRSGTADGGRADKIRSAAREKGFDVIDVKPGVDIPGTVRDAMKKGDRLFIAAGGDGTVHHVMQALVGSEGRLGIIPAGTLNHLAKDLGIPLEWEEALELAVSDSTRMIDVGDVNGTYFTNILLLGIYPDMVRERERLRHWYGKTRAYARAILMSIRRFHHVSLSLETAQRTEQIRTPVFAVAVNRYELNEPGLSAQKASFDDAQLAVYWLPNMGRLSVAKIILKFVGGRLELGRDLKTLYTRALKVQSRHPKVRIGMNGELAEMKMPMEIRVVPSSLRVVAPPETPKSRESNPD